LELNNLLYYLVVSFIILTLGPLQTPIILGIKDYLLSFWIQTAAFVTGSPTPIKLGIPIKIYFFKKYLNISVIKTTTVMLYEILIRSIVLLVLLLLFGGLQYLAIIKNIYFIFAIFVIIISIIFFLFKYKTGGLIEKIKTKIFLSINELKKITNSWNTAIKIIVIQIVLQLMSILRVMFILNSLSVESLTLLQISRVVLATSFLSMISMIPGGYGIREISIIYLLQLEGLDYSNSIFISLADRSLQTGIAMIFGIFSSIYFAKFHKQPV